MTIQDMPTWQTLMLIKEVTLFILMKRHSIETNRCSFKCGACIIYCIPTIQWP